MSDYYTGRHAQYYNLRWHSFTERTLAETISMIDIAQLQGISVQQGRPPRVLDVACGTGVLLKMLFSHVPGMKGYGMDASADMLAQAQIALVNQPHVQLHQATLGNNASVNLPYPLHSFDLITCTNALHDVSNPVQALTELRRLLAPEGRLVVEDYARHGPPFLWALLEWLIRRVEKGQVQAYSVAEAKSLCVKAGLCIEQERAFILNWLWHGWALCLSVTHDSMSQQNEDEEKREKNEEMHRK